MKFVIIILLLSFSVYGQIGLGFGNSFGNGGGFGNNFGGGNGFGNSFGNGGGFGNGFGNGGGFGVRQSSMGQGMGQVGGNGFGNSFGNGLGNNSGNGIGGGFGSGSGNSGGLNSGGGNGVGSNIGNNGTNSVNNTNNVYRPAAVGINQRRKDNNGYNYGIINADPSSMFSGRTFSSPIRRVVMSTNSLSSTRQYLRLNSRSGKVEADPEPNSSGIGQNNTNKSSVNSIPTKTN